MDLLEYIEKIPKAELHLHIEGTLQPELLLKLAKRNNVSLPYSSIQKIKDAYQFQNLQDFLDIYYAGANVLRTEQDFFDLTWDYLEDAHRQHIIHVEIFFDPQTHTERGIPFSVIISGIHKAMERAKKNLGINSQLILSFLRHLPEESAFKTWEEAKQYKHLFVGIGLDSSELGNPPKKFKNIFAEAKKDGMKLVAHAGEEGPASYVREAIDVLNIDRIDHGNKCLDDENLVTEIIKKGLALTICPLSNIVLKNTPCMEEHPILKMLEKGLKVTVNSDDPAYFGGNLVKNFEAMATNLPLTKNHVYQLTKNAFEASFIDESLKEQYLKQLDEFHHQFA
ncbi:adenosine deaminase [Balneicella halophila]|uniref:Adenine deaminase n=1 Tax=Balneicella halophila TaxID=1537566 RepID=A0A7L4UN28_BALHA|nr:adenosine deaminase [Balneicella halophila]PVX50034.1 adenosine deaminase [Balneicella halophila]